VYCSFIAVLVALHAALYKFMYIVYVRTLNSVVHTHFMFLTITQYTLHILPLKMHFRVTVELGGSIPMFLVSQHAHTATHTRVYTQTH
jgi:hypothetical protein